MGSLTIDVQGSLLFAVLETSYARVHNSYSIKVLKRLRQIEVLSFVADMKSLAAHLGVIVVGRKDLDHPYFQKVFSRVTELTSM